MSEVFERILGLRQAEASFHRRRTRNINDARFFQALHRGAYGICMSGDVEAAFRSQRLQVDGRQLGEAGARLHTGRSRNEQIATDLRLFVRQSIDTLRNLIADWIEAILTRAEAAGSAAIPAYTHLQPAEPVLVAHWLLAYGEMFLRDATRLADCRKRVNLCPLGSGAVAGATLTINRQTMAAELGFDGPTANSIDATSDRDFAIEFVDALSLLTLHLSRWAEEMILFSTPAYGFVELPEPYSTGSSAMPQKKNPDLLELVRGKAARVMGCAATLQTLVKGLPLAYNKDLQETQEPVFNASDTVKGPPSRSRNCGLKSAASTLWAIKKQGLPVARSSPSTISWFGANSSRGIL